MAYRSGSASFLGARTRNVRMLSFREWTLASGSSPVSHYRRSTWPREPMAAGAWGDKLRSYEQEGLRASALGSEQQQTLPGTCWGNKWSKGSAQGWGWGGPFDFILANVTHTLTPRCPVTSMDQGLTRPFQWDTYL